MRESRPRGAAPVPPPRAVQPGDRPLGAVLVIVVIVGVLAALVDQHASRLRAAFQPGQAPPAQIEANRRAPALTEQRPVAVAIAQPAPTPSKPEPRMPAPPVTELTAVPSFSSEGMEAEIGPDGQVLLTSKYAIQRVEPGNPDERRVLYTPQHYLRQFPDLRPQAMASALALPGERYLFGGWHGEVLLLVGERMVRLAGDGPRPQGRIADLQRWGERVLVAGDGLWELTPDGRGLREIPLYGVGRIRTTAPHGNVLLIADGRAIHEWDGSRVQRWLQAPDGGSLEMLAPAEHGGWWIGSTAGLYRADGARTVKAVLPGVWVTGVAERAGELWVASWKQGLLLRRADRWYRLDRPYLPTESVSAVAIDGADHAWITLYGGGALHAPLAVLRRQLLDHRWTPAPDP